MFDDESVSIINAFENGNMICAASGRISSTQGSALSILDKTKKSENNENLIRKVLRSGHKSIMEHCVFSLAFNNVSVLVEEFIIEFRLASYTVQSRRYVDFSNAKYFSGVRVPSDCKERFNSFVKGLFSDYSSLVDLGIPREDARFVLPYCFCSNFYCTCNARELLAMICSMLYGRGSRYPELVMLGESLKEQFEPYFPSIVEMEKPRFLNLASLETPLLRPAVAAPEAVCANISLIAHSTLGEDMLKALSAYNWSEYRADGEIVGSERPRELEMLSCTYKIENISLAALTHLVRHRIQSILVPPVITAAFSGKHILPETVAGLPEAKKIYSNAFAKAYLMLRDTLDAGMPVSDSAYFALSGNTLDVVFSMNGRELEHFFCLRTCNRAQWEIRDIAVKALSLARIVYPDTMKKFGPSCYVTGICPEGRLTCGKNKEMCKRFSEL